MTSVSLRPATPGDVLHLEAMLVEAAQWDPEREREPAETVLARPEFARYVEGWGRTGDVGVVARRGGRRVGAAWARRFPPDEPGFGFVHEDVPELSVAVAPEARGAGVGAALVEALLAALAEAEVGQVSLSVETANPAVRLYRRLGFRALPGDDGGDAVTMVADTAPGVVERRLGRLRVERFDHPAVFLLVGSGYIGGRLLGDALDLADGFGRTHPEGWAYVIDPTGVVFLNPGNLVTLRRVHRLPNNRHYIVATTARRFRAGARLARLLDKVTAIVDSVDDALAVVLNRP